MALPAEPLSTRFSSLSISNETTVNTSHSLLYPSEVHTQTIIILFVSIKSNNNFLCEQLRVDSDGQHTRAD